MLPPSSIERIAEKKGPIKGLFHFMVYLDPFDSRWRSLKEWQAAVRARVARHRKILKCCHPLYFSPALKQAENIAGRHAAGVAPLSSAAEAPLRAERRFKGFRSISNARKGRRDKGAD